MRKVKMTFNVSPEIKDEIEVCADTYGYKSVSEFCKEGMEFYLAYLHHEHNKSYIDKVMVQTVDATVEKHADRISDVIFKLAVSIEKQNLIKNGYFYDEVQLETDAITNVKLRHGNL